MRRLLSALIFASAFALLLWLLRAATQPTSTPIPRTHDDARIVALSPALAITLRDLGLADRIVGRHAYDMVLDKSIPVCGDQSGLDYETLIRVNPTHILLPRGSQDIPPRLRSLADQNHWTILDYPQLTLDDVFQTTLALGSAFAPPGDVKFPSSDIASTLSGPQIALLKLTERMKAAWQTPRPPLHTGRILLLESLDPPAALGPGSFHHQILERLGATSAITGGKPYMVLDLEDIQRLAPEGIILFAPRPPAQSPVPLTSPAPGEVGAPAQQPSPTDLRKRLGRLATLDIPALKNNHIALIDDPLALTPSSALLSVTEQMDRILRGWSEP